jgi:hypothetical protein
MGGSGSDLLEVLARNFPERPEENYKNLSQDISYQDGKYNQIFPKHKPRVLPQHQSARYHNNIW